MRTHRELSGLSGRAEARGGKVGATCAKVRNMLNPAERGVDGWPLPNAFGHSPMRTHRELSELRARNYTADEGGTGGRNVRS